MLNRIIKGAIAGLIIAGSFGIVIGILGESLASMFPSAHKFSWSNTLPITFFSFLVGGIVGGVQGEVQRQISALTIGITIGAIAGIYLAIVFSPVRYPTTCSDGLLTKDSIFTNTFYWLPIGTIIGSVIGVILEQIFQRISFFSENNSD